MSKVEIEVNEDAIEPKEYFKILKANKKKQTTQKLESQLETISEHIIAAKKVGQTNFLEKLAFTYDTLKKEQILLSHGYEQFMYKDDIKHFIDNVTPANSIKIIELERYPRTIPLETLQMIQDCKDKELFDDYVIVFTDFTGVRHDTEAEKKFVERNRDPVLFGFYKHNTSGLKHDRFYFIDDWEDEHCDLTFGKMVEKMGEMGLENPAKKISDNEEYLNEIVNNTLESMKKEKQYGEIPAEIKKKSFWDKFWPAKKKAA